MLTIKVHIDNEIRKSIKDAYGKDNYQTINSAVNNIIKRYLNIEYLNPELSTDEDDNYKICEFCGEKSKSSKMIDIDGKNLEEHEICENCGAGYPVLK